MKLQYRDMKGSYHGMKLQYRDMKVLYRDPKLQYRGTRLEAATSTPVHPSPRSPSLSTQGLPPPHPSTNHDG